jgi:hypothetical protein
MIRIVPALFDRPPTAGIFVDNPVDLSTPIPRPVSAG